MRPVRVDFPYLMPDRSRHGKPRLYIRKNGRKIRIREKLGTEAFAQAYADALYALDHGAVASRATIKGAPAGTLGWLAACYFAIRRIPPARSEVAVERAGSIIEDCLREPRKPDSTDLMRDCPVAALSSGARQDAARSQGRDMPGAANNRRKYLSSMFGWAVDDGSMRIKPGARNSPDPLRQLRFSYLDRRRGSSIRGAAPDRHEGKAWRSRFCSISACAAATS